MRRPRLVIAIVVALFVLCLVAARRVVAANSVRLPDGSRIKLMAVASGRETITVEWSLIRFVRAHLPPKFRDQLPSAAYFYGPGSSNARSLAVRIDSPRTP